MLKVEGQENIFFSWPLMEPFSSKLKSSMKGRAKKITSTSHGVLEQVVWGIHKRPNAFLLWPIHKNFEKFESSNRCQAQMFLCLATKVGG